MKRILSLLIAVTLLLSLCSVPSFAKEDTETEGAAKLLGSYQYSSSNINCKITFDSSLLDVKSDRCIKIALVDGDANGTIARFSVDPTLTIYYITLD